MGWIAPAIAAVGSIAGGAIGQSGSSKRFQRWQMAENERLQKEFAQNGIQWKVADAKAAGLHPLAALGAQTQSFAPIAVGGGDSPNYMGEAVANMGQDISRAIEATKSEKERQRTLADLQQRQARVDQQNAETHAANLEGQRLENQYRALQVQKLQRDLISSRPIPSGSSGVGNRSVAPVGAVQVNPSEGTSSMPGVVSVEAAATPGFKQYRVGGPHTGFTIELPASSSMGEAMESMGALYSGALTTYHQGSRWLDNKLDHWSKPSVHTRRGRRSARTGR